MSDDKPMTLDRMLAVIVTADDWLDGGVAATYRAQPLAQTWARVAKVMEEGGEAVSALIAVTGQNPRKGVCGTMDQVTAELADVWCTAFLAIQHLTKDPAETWAILTGSLAKLEARSAGWPALKARLAAGEITG